MPDAYSQQMARQFLEMWQQQMESTLNDREFVQGLLRMMAAAPGGEPFTSRAPAHAKSPAPAAFSPDALADALDGLQRRLAACETGISELFARLDGMAGRSAKPADGSQPRRKPSRAPSHGKPGKAKPRKAAKRR